MLEKYPDLLTVKKTAVLLNRSEWSVRDLCRRNVLPCVRVEGRLLIPKAQLLEYLSAHMTGVE